LIPPLKNDEIYIYIYIFARREEDTGNNTKRGLRQKRHQLVWRRYWSIITTREDGNDLISRIVMA
jgi:hypothetical protein